MSHQSDINLLADLAYLTSPGGTLWWVQGSPAAPLLLPLASGLPVVAMSLEKCLGAPASLTSARGILVTLPADDIALAREIASKFRSAMSGPLLVRIASGGAGTKEAWNTIFIGAGWRRHPLGQLRFGGNEGEDDPTDCLLAYLPLSATEIETYSGDFLQTERALHMDMLREAGRRADAHLARYAWAAGFVRPNDVVLDAACGMGYGSVILRFGSRCRQVLGLDSSRRAVDYARTVYGAMAPQVEFRVATLPGLEFIADNSLDCVVSFETLEHLADPAAFLAEVLRTLKPGGRFLCSVPNRWVDETGRDPSPHHLQTFDLSSLLKLCGCLRLDQVIGQCAGVNDPRFSTTRRMEIFDAPPPAGELRAESVEWWLLSGIKDPLANAACPYLETVFPALLDPSAGSPGYTQGYANPWLVHSMVHGPFRLRSPLALARLAREALAQYCSGSADHGAALAILLYQAIEGSTGPELDTLESKTREHLAHQPSAPHEHRWQISLRFALAQWLLMRGDADAAQHEFLLCAAMDFADFAPHIATKSTEAALLAGRLALVAGNVTGAQDAWKRGLEIGRSLAAVPLDQVLIDREHPHVWGTGDGMREYVLALDNVSRCANGLHHLAEYRQGGIGRFCDLERSWQEADARSRSQAQSLRAQARLVRNQNEYIAGIQKERDRLTGEADAAKIEAARVVRDSQQHLDALTAQLNHTVADSQKVIDALKSQLERTVADSEKLVARYEAHLTSLKAQLDQLAATSRGQTDHIAKLQKEYKRLAALTESQHKDITHYVKVIHEQTAYIKQLEFQRPEKPT